MALRIAHGALACVRRGLASRSCDGAAPPACAPCPPPPRPPCRATPPATLRASRRVCCPPPAGHPPPCPPAPCAPPLTCGDAMTSGKGNSRRSCMISDGCGSDRDRVARRLSLAEIERRKDYEREVAERPSKYMREPPLAPYTLGGERECARATDGREYAIKCERSPPAPCGPDRTPPPPRCVELVRDTECTVRRGAYLDPCAHVPRTIVDIDRSSGRSPSRDPPQSPSSAPPNAAYPSSSNIASHAATCAMSHTPASPPERSPPAKNLTSRIMEKLSLNRNSASSCPRRSSEPKCDTTGARRAGDTGWCQTQPKPPSVPPCCREPTTMEKIKRRGPSHCAREKGGGSGGRAFHSYAADRWMASVAAGNSKKTPDTIITMGKNSADVELLKKVLKERESLQEAGRGRVVGEIRETKTQSAASGRLDIPVPLGAQNVSIRVSLDGTQSCCNSNVGPDTTIVKCSSSDGPSANSGKSASWLSLKGLQQKLASCRKNDSMKIFKDNKQDGGRAPATCPRPQPPTLKPPAPRNPCAAPAKPRGDPCPPPTPLKPRDPCKTPTPSKPRNPCGAPSPSKVPNPCVTPSTPLPTNPCAAPAPSKPRNPCGNVSPLQPGGTTSTPKASDPSKTAPSAPAAPHQRSCPTQGKPGPKNTTRFSTFNDERDSLEAETLLIL